MRNVLPYIVFGLLVSVSCAFLVVGLDHLLFPRSIETEAETETESVSPSDTLSDWQVLEMAIAFTESRFKTDAIGKAEDTGILQIRPIYVEEVNRLTGRNYTIVDAFNADMSLEMFNLMQDARNPGRDIDEAIRLHNKSPYYRKVVLENMELIRRAEDMRRKIINFGE